MYNNMGFGRPTNWPMQHASRALFFSMEITRLAVNLVCPITIAFRLEDDYIHTYIHSTSILIWTWLHVSKIFSVDCTLETSGDG